MADIFDTDDAAGRALAAGTIIATAALDGSDVRRAARRALDVLDPDDGLVFAVFLAAAVGNLFRSQTNCGNHPLGCDCPVTIDVEDFDGSPTSIDDIDATDRTAWRAALAAANGGDPTPFLITVDGPESAATVTGKLIDLFVVMFRSQAVNRGE